MVVNWAKTLYIGIFVCKLKNGVYGVPKVKFWKHYRSDKFS